MINIVRGYDPDHYIIQVKEVMAHFWCLWCSLLCYLVPHLRITTSWMESSCRVKTTSLYRIETTYLMLPLDAEVDMIWVEPTPWHQMVLVRIRPKLHCIKITPIECYSSLILFHNIYIYFLQQINISIKKDTKETRLLKDLMRTKGSPVIRNQLQQYLDGLRKGKERVLSYSCKWSMLRLQKCYIGISWLTLPLGLTLDFFESFAWKIKIIKLHNWK